MRPVDQSILHDPSNGKHGDCMRAVVASLFELPIDAVPHFLDGGCEADEFNQRINAWLRPVNLAYLPINGIGASLSSLGIEGLHHEASGPGARGAYHACAALDGKVTHDPHPTKSGLNSIETSGVFVVLDPSKSTGQRRSAGNRWYLAGPMTDLPLRNFPAFHAEAGRLRAHGFDIVSPAELCDDIAGQWALCMRRDVTALLTCDGVAMLPGWEGSKGARLERHIAVEIGMPVVDACDLGAPITAEVAE